VLIGLGIQVDTHDGKRAGFEGRQARYGFFNGGRQGFGKRG